MLQLAKDLPGEKVIVLGYKDEIFLQKAFALYGKVVIATEDGSYGVHGNVLDAIRQMDLTGDMICSCGPTPMLRAVKSFSQEKGIPAWISLEERMACGVGACLGCVCKSTDIDSHSHVNNKRVCKDGPVFDAAEVEI
jgi:dihydroorotate dehydrogenase electron transfer subunit